VAGTVLAGIVWKFFEKIESVLTDDTKREIARWLRVRNLETGIVTNPPKPWQNTFTEMFDRTFGKRHLSWRCFFRSCCATLAACLLCSIVNLSESEGHIEWLTVVTAFAVASVSLFVFDYVSLLETRFVLSLMKRCHSASLLMLFLILDLIATGATGSGPAVLVIVSFNHYFSVEAAGARNLKEDLMHRQQLIKALKEHSETVDTYDHDKELELEELLVKREQRDPLLNPPPFGLPSPRILSDLATIFWLPTFFTSIWLWLYAGSGFFLIFAQRFDKFFAWFNSHVDIDKKPLAAIGLVAGCIVAVLWWGVVLVRWLLSMS